ATSWAGRLRLVPAVRHGLRRWEVLNVRDTFGGVWDILTRSEHGLRSFSRRLGPAVEKEQPVLSISISESSLQCRRRSKISPLPQTWPAISLAPSWSRNSTWRIAANCR